MNRKVTVVGGAGNVGATVARGVADKQLADVVIIDIADQKAAGVALDMLEACPIGGSDARVLGTGDYAESAGSDIVDARLRSAGRAPPRWSEPAPPARRTARGRATERRPRARDRGRGGPR